jgi:hypothetical protein
MYLISENAQTAHPTTKDTSSLKGESLISTPETFYREIFDFEDNGDDVVDLPNLSLMESFSEGFNTVTSGSFSTKVVPYPILYPVYLGLRYKLHSDNCDFELDMLNDVFRVYYWRTCFSSRYDHGYLTQAVSDLKKIIKFLSVDTNIDAYETNKIEWWENLDKMLTVDMRAPIPSVSEIQLDLESKNRGAKDKTYKSLLYVKVPLDLKTSNKLIRRTSSDIELHHIFPKNWVRNNAISHLDKLDYPTILVPLSKKSNIKWSATDPDLQINEWHTGHSWTSMNHILSSLLVNQNSYNPLTDQSFGTAEDRLVSFLDERKKTLTNTTILLSTCDDLPFDLIYSE